MRGNGGGGGGVPAVTLASFNRAVEPFRGVKVLGGVRRASALSRLRGSPAVKKAWLELAVDGAGYCTLRVFKAQSDVRPAGEMRFVGPAVECVSLAELPVEASGCQLGLKVSGPDLRREDGRPGGDVFFFAKDQRELTMVMHAVTSLARSCRPDGSCRFALVHASQGALEKQHAQLVSRACTRLVAFKAAPKGILNELSQAVDRDDAMAYLNSPDADAGDAAVAARGLLAALEALPSRPVGASAFAKFSSQVASASDMDAGVVHAALEALVARLAQPYGVKVLQDASLAVRHLVFELKCNTLREAAEELGPLLVEGRPESDAVVALLAACCSAKHRDRVFLAAASSAVNGAPPPQPAHADELQRAPVESSDGSTTAASLTPATTSAAATAAATTTSSESAAARNSALAEDIAALARLHHWLSARLNDDPEHANAALWRRELDMVAADLAAHGPTLLLMPPPALVVPPRAMPLTAPRVASPREAKRASDSEGGAAASQGRLVEEALSLWATVRREPVGASTEQARAMLNDTLDKIQQLAMNVREDDFADAAAGSRPTVLAMIGLLEENARLRLRMAMLPPGGDVSPPAVQPMATKPVTPAKSKSSSAEDVVVMSSSKLDDMEYEI